MTENITALIWMLVDTKENFQYKNIGITNLSTLPKGSNNKLCELKMPHQLTHAFALSLVPVTIHLAYL